MRRPSIERAVAAHPESPERDLRKCDQEEYDRRIEAIEPVEYLLANARHFERMHEKGSRLAEDYLRIYQRDPAAMQQIETIEQLKQGRVVPTREQVGKPGRNQSVIPCVIETPDRETILAYMKTMFCSAQFFLEEKKGRFFRVRSAFDGRRMSRTLEPADAEEDTGMPVDGIRRNIELTDEHEQFLSDVYGIDASRLRVMKNPFGLFSVDSQQESGSVVASYWLKALMFPKNPGVIPETVFRNANGVPVTLQRGVGRTGMPGGHFFDLYARGNRHPLATPLAQVAGMQWSNKDADGTSNNMALLSDTAYSIDNGSAFMHSSPKDTSDADAHFATHFGTKQFSCAWEITRDIGADLPEEDRRHFKEIIADYNTYHLIRSGAIPKEKAALYPDHVRNGLVAKLLVSIVRLAHERVDEEGRVIPETRKVAEKELAFLIARLDYLAEFGHPPNDERFYNVRGYKEKYGSRVADHVPSTPPPPPKRKPPPPSQRVIEARA